MAARLVGRGQPGHSPPRRVVRQARPVCQEIGERGRLKVLMKSRGLVGKHLADFRVPGQQTIVDQHAKQSGGHRLGARTNVNLILNLHRLGCPELADTYSGDAREHVSFHDRADQSGEVMGITNPLENLPQLRVGGIGWVARSPEAGVLLFGNAGLRTV